MIPPPCRYCHRELTGRSGVCVRCYGDNLKPCAECISPSGYRRWAYRRRGRPEVPVCPVCGNDRRDLRPPRKQRKRKGKGHV